MDFRDPRHLSTLCPNFRIFDNPVDMTTSNCTSKRLKSYGYVTLTISLICLFLFIGQIQAQLPPTIHRVAPFDTEIDGPFSNEKLSVFLSPSFDKSFGTCWNTIGKSLLIPSHKELMSRPITLLAFVKFPPSSHHNIICATDPKSSPSHWELFTTPEDGKLGFYIPGNSIDTFISERVFADGEWHYLTLHLSDVRFEVCSDGQKFLEGNIDRPFHESESNFFAIGSTVEQDVFSSGLIDEFLIRQGEPEGGFSLTESPKVPFIADEKTILLLHFESDDQKSSENISTFFENLIAPREMLNRKKHHITFNEIVETFPTCIIPLEGSVASSGTETVKIKISNEVIEQLFPKGGVEIEVPPGWKPPKNIEIRECSPEQFDKEAERLGITGLSADLFRPGVFAFWGEQFVELSKQISGEIALPRGATEQLFDSETLVRDEESTPAQIVIRRTYDILNDLTGTLPPETEERIASGLRKIGESIAEEIQKMAPDENRLTTDFFLAAALRRELMFSNPELDDLTDILFLARGCYAGSRLTNLTNTDRIGGHFATQVYGFNSIHGGGIFTLSDWREKYPIIKNLLEGKKVSPTQYCNRLAGRELNYGSFYKPEVSYDGKTVYFSHSGASEHRWFWTPDTTWNIFRLDLETETAPAQLTQLTDSSYNDFDVCELPSGRLVFASERRGGFIRCFGEDAQLRVTTSVLHTMKSDGTDIYPISFFETGEWRPSVDHNGMLAYTRWDYTDRENCLGSTYWTCFPDGRNPRSPHGNYPQPWHTFDDNTHGDHRWGTCEDAPSGLPMAELQFRAIPNSHRMIFTAAPHHGETFGSLCILDLRVPDDNHMSRVKRLTPYFPFPESEMPARSQYCYGSPWPISEDLYMCNRWEDLILLDRYGNEELLCEREILPIGYDPRLRLSEPIPLAPREKPPVVPQQTAQGIDNIGKPQNSTVGVVNVNVADLALPADRPPKRLRVIQVIPKPNPWMDFPWIGYATENTPRIPLGTVPIEEDGSVYFEAPSGKQLLFQVLDENNMAIQTMRAVTYLHPGENLLCIGCHEPLDISLENELAKVTPSAFSRAPSRLEPECGPVEPLSFYRHIRPILEERCLPCHKEMNVEPLSMDYEDLRPYVYYFSGGMSGATLRNGPHGGSRSRPGHLGASESRLGTVLFNETHRDTVSEEDRHRLILWMDANAPRLSAFRDEEAQKQGKLIWPVLDTEPCELYNPAPKTK